MSAAGSDRGAAEQPASIEAPATSVLPICDLINLGDLLNIDAKVASVVADIEAETGESERPSPKAADPPATTGWPPLRLPGSIQRPTFPLSTLAPWHREYVGALAEAHQVSPDGPAMLSIAVIGAAASKRVEVALGGGDNHPTNIWTLVVMPSGEGKSPIVTPLSAPLLRAQDDLRQAANAVKKAADLERAILTQKRADLIRACARAIAQDDVDRLRAEALAIDDRLSELGEHPLPKLVTEDTTNEALARLMFQNKGAIALVSDEGSAFFANAARNTRGGVEAIEVLLKAHSGTTFFRDRMTAESFTVPEPALAVAIATQAKTFSRLVRRESFLGRGLWERFLLVLPPSRVGNRQGISRPTTIHQTTSFAGATHSLLRLPVVERGEGRLQLHLTEEARRMFGSFCEEIDRRMVLGADLASESMIAWANKIRTNVLRVAGCLLLSDFAPPLDADERVVLDVDVLGRGIDIMRYCLVHAQSVLVGPSQLPADADVALEWLRERVTPVFRARDLQRARHRVFPERKQLQPVLDELARLGVIRSVPESGNMGRPPEEYEIHPELAGRSVTK